MAKKKNSSKKKSTGSSVDFGAIREVSNIDFGSKLPLLIKTLGGVSILVAVLQIFALFDAGGYAGNLVQKTMLQTFGFMGYAAFIALFYLGVHLILVRKPNLSLYKVLHTLLGILSLTGLINVLDGFTPLRSGGMIGDLFGLPLYSLFSLYPSLLFLFLVTLYSLSALIGHSIVLERLSLIKSRFSRDSSDEEAEEESGGAELPWYKRIFSRRTAEYYEEDEISEDNEIDADDTLDANDIRNHILGVKNVSRKPRKEVELEDDEEEEDNEEPIQKKPVPAAQPKPKAIPRPTSFTPPPLSLLQRDSGKPSVGDTKANMAVIKRTLAEFGITVEMDEVSIGPSVTRYTLKPAQGVKLSRIANHRQELAYALRAESIRIEAPIPGKALVGIEIPNQSKSMVGLASLLATDTWARDERPLLVALGKGISGTPLYSNLAKMPHVLIAGTTGSGKSVMVHAIINSLLFRNDPSMLKFIMVDPKKVELTLYNSIPHLYTPVITNAKLAIRTLTWAVNEMERRYDTLEENSERDIASYHKNVYQKAVQKAKGDDSDLPERMPYIVIIIDELADIMMSYPKELEAAIVRLAQKSRAVGIHLILSTQRPSVNVITGLIKANIPSRIALKVASQVDSRTIIDTAGAEQLLGQGDLLFTSSESPKQERVQSAFVSDQEVKNVVEYLKKAYRDEIRDEINVEHNPGGDKTMNALFSTDMGSASGGDTDDDLFEQAKEIVISSKKASTSYLQRRLKIGYSRAARLMDMLEEQGIIGAQDGAKPREVLVGGDTAVFADDSDEE